MYRIFCLISSIKLSFLNIQKEITMKRSAYEIARIERIERNEKILRELGLQDAAKATRLYTEKRKKKIVVKERRRKHRKIVVPSRRSSRRSSTLSSSQLQSLPDTWKENKNSNTGVRRPDIYRFKYPRLSKEQSVALQTKVGEYVELTETELNAAKKASEIISAGFEVSGRKMKGDAYYVRARRVIDECKCRKPKWVEDLQKRMFDKMGSTSTSRQHTIYLIERAAAGLGLVYVGWPEGVGLSVNRAVSICDDVEVLRFQGKFLEHHYGKDSGNGWAYNHALGYIKKYQAMILSELGYDGPSEGTIREISQIFHGKSLCELACDCDEEEIEEDEDIELKGIAAAMQCLARVGIKGVVVK